MTATRRVLAAVFVPLLLALTVCSLSGAFAATQAPADPANPADKAVASAAVGQAADSPEGHWEGAINIPGSELKVLVDLSRDSSGVLKGTIDIPAQGAKALALEKLEFTAPKIEFTIAAVPGTPTFHGTLDAAAGTIAGDFTQGEATFPFTLAHAAAPAQAAADALGGFREFVAQVLKDWNVAGASVAVVKGDQVILSEGFGQRDIEKKLPVTADTLFAIGSSTKAFTATLVAMQVEDGKLDWDKPVRTWLPTFKLQDEFATQRMTPVDLLCHRSGLPRHDLVWYGSSLNREQIFDRLEYLEPSEDFRTAWQYQNLMVMTAGHLSEVVGGAPWEQLVRTRILEPLGMTGSNLSVNDSQKTGDYAIPYVEQEHVNGPVPLRDVDSMAPAGSINSSSNDMAKWLIFNLGDGAASGSASTPAAKPLLTGATLQFLHSPRMVMTSSMRDPEISLPSYALGWFVESYRGHTRVQHGGNIDGFSAQVSLVPSAGIGVVVLTNANGSPVPEIVARNVTDRLLGLDPIDWNARTLQRHKVAEAAEERATDNAGLDRKTGTHPSHPLADYAGDYEHPAYGVITIAAPANTKSAELTAEVHELKMHLTPWHYDTFQASFDDRGLAGQHMFLQFLTNLKGDADRIEINLEPTVKPIVFTRRPPARLTDPAFLKTLVGDYALVDSPDAVASISLHGDSTLVVNLTHQPEYTLIPYQNTEFQLKGLTGFSLRFILDPAGRVTEILFIQPDGIYKARKR